VLRLSLSPEQTAGAKTMLMSANAFELVKATVEDLADELGYDTLRNVSADTRLFGGDHGIDSLSLVRLIAELERAAETKLGRRVVLADERAMSRHASPFRSVGTLAALLEERMEAAGA
jgi:acyl carrier protein